ncbi:TlpA family protein disulfide reductase [Flavobacterium sp. NRK F10]|uniref:TlpA family protein disulfide reductase n=1 Tax=Flavobacterium sp. NRK F10 TaxID=2954931 RepID=UPI00209101A5|nr:TlpA family protein disulfide reductase [Flavobacterium sp. NRK F10]MCO6175999.1 TlpA family protein disulfide reductase [Flavobacterium sp. NRK F10]
MKKIALLFIGVLALISCEAQNNTEFSKEALENKMISKENQSVTFQEIIEQYKGKTVFIDVWASWCPDCVKGMPKVKALQKEHPELVYLFISMDKTYDAWLKGIEKYEVTGEHYLTTDGMKGIFGKSIALDWIPRYMIVDKTGKIALFKVIEADDAKIEETLSKLE